MTALVSPFTVRARGEIDLDTAPRLRRELERALSEHHVVVLDLSQVTFMDCAGLGALVQARNRADHSGRRLVVHGISRPVARLLTLAGLTRRLAPAPGAAAGGGAAGRAPSTPYDTLLGHPATPGRHPRPQHPRGGPPPEGHLP
ncbi:STAS domain-containing protein [Streptomyces sp. NRRL WC-3742]|uniref:STAS domain-containing protein n=1 Tax=Streptomyces sp. NRRL WC-3742 TaxID=1463934 RepID=UPI00068D9CED|nr:STAS domain-containing protein [Streptomyces sp. NRRL WC-3742]